MSTRISTAAGALVQVPDQSWSKMGLEALFYLGTSGWQYRHWKSRFYPDDVPQREWLEYYCRHFQTVELNNSFYNLPTAAAFRSWRERTPADFIVAVKASRFLTHIKKLNDPAEPVHRLMERAAELGPKLGPVLVQLPPRFAAVPDRLEETLARFPRRVRVAVEFRDDSWYSDEVRDILTRRDAALVLADSPRRKQPFWKTAAWGFVRFHEGRATPRPCYGVRALETWVDRLVDMYREEEDVFVYFNNDPLGCALRDVGEFARLLAKRGRSHTGAEVKVRVG